MKLNDLLVKEIKSKGIDYSEAIVYLLSLYFELDEPNISQQTIRQINHLKFVEKDHKTDTLTWNLPLFEGQNIDDPWSWINDFRDLFKAKNKERVGIKQACVKRMKKFFAENPEIRKEDVIQATKAYLRVTNPAYIKNSHKFIMDGRGVMSFSMLKEWCDKVEARKEESNEDPNVKMM